MCLEATGIALCAPQNPPALSFTCGKLHIIAEERINCAKAHGNCVCYFGTCGSITTVASPVGVDLAGIVKVRCQECTVREDNLGDRRNGQEILESPLLGRSAVCLEGEAGAHYLAELKSLWEGKTSCPYHQIDRSDKSAVVPTHGEGNTKTISIDVPSVSELSITAATTAHFKEKTATTTKLKPAVGLAASRWAKANAPSAKPYRRAMNPSATVFNPSTNRNVYRKTEGPVVQSSTNPTTQKHGQKPNAAIAKDDVQAMLSNATKFLEYTL